MSHCKWAARAILAAALGLAVSIGQPGPVMATETTAEAEAEGPSRRDIGDRLVIAGRQRMLAEGMASKLCFILTDVAEAESRGDLYVMWNIFGWYHAGILRGNPQLGLAAERAPQVRAAWRRIDRDWNTLKPLYTTVLERARMRSSEFDRIVDFTINVTDSATELVASMRAVYADKLGPRGFGSALLIDLYERQRMLAQRISKDVCMVARGDTTQTRLAGLTKALQFFSLSLDAFLNGRAEVGVPAPPSSDIAVRLKAAQTHWLPIEQLARDAADGRGLDRDELRRFYVGMDLFISEMTGAIAGLVAIKAEQ